jgi:hypothetical protein
MNDDIDESQLIAVIGLDAEARIEVVSDDAAELSGEITTAVGVACGPRAQIAARGLDLTHAELGRLRKQASAREVRARALGSKEAAARRTADDPTAQRERLLAECNIAGGLGSV